MKTLSHHLWSHFAAATPLPAHDPLEDVDAAIAAELDAQAEAIDRRVQYHGLGPHGVCQRCEAWRVIAVDLRGRAAAIRLEAGA